MKGWTSGLPDIYLFIHNKKDKSDDEMKCQNTNFIHTELMSWQQATILAKNVAYNHTT